MKHKVQRDVLSQKAGLFRVNVCAPPSNNKLSKSTCRNERMSLCALKKGSLTVEAALILPWVIGILLTFFSYFQQYELGAQLSIRAAAEAKKIAIAVGCSQEEDYGDVVIYQSQVWEPTSFFAFLGEKAITQKAVCRPWIGFTDQEESETYVYVTPNGSVYHLFRDCTHLNISTKAVEAQKAKSMKNQYGGLFFCNTEVDFLVQYILKTYLCAVYIFHSHKGEFICYALIPIGFLTYIALFLSVIRKLFLFFYKSFYIVGSSGKAFEKRKGFNRLFFRYFFGCSFFFSNSYSFRSLLYGISRQHHLQTEKRKLNRQGHKLLCENTY